VVLAEIVGANQNHDGFRMQPIENPPSDVTKGLIDCFTGDAKITGIIGRILLCPDGKTCPLPVSGYGVA